MIDKSIEIVPDMIVRQDEGLTYKVDDLREDTRNYEIIHELGGWTVNYTQLEDGDKKPAGTSYNKDEEGFRQHFTVVEQPE